MKSYFFCKYQYFNRCCVTRQSFDEAMNTGHYTVVLIMLLQGVEAVATDRVDMHKRVDAHFMPMVEQVSAGILSFLGHLFGSDCFSRDVNPSKIISSSFESRLACSKRKSDICSSVNNVLQGCPSLCLQ